MTWTASQERRAYAVVQALIASGAPYAVWVRGGGGARFAVDRSTGERRFTLYISEATFSLVRTVGVIAPDTVGRGWVVTEAARDLVRSFETKHHGRVVTQM